MKQRFVRAWLPLTVCAALVAGAAAARGLRQAPDVSPSGSPDVVARVGDRVLTRVEAERLARAFGREVAQAYLSDDALRGTVTVVGTDGTHLLHAVERIPEEAIPFAEAASQVEEELRRERSEGRYRALLRDLAARTGAELPAYVLAPR